MDEQLNKTEKSCVSALLRPAIKFCLKRSISIRDLVEISRSVFIEVASEELRKQGIKPTDSRLCALTGIQRTAVKDYKENGLQKGTTQYLYRVIGQWRRDKQYLNISGKPRSLSVRGNDSEFYGLVRLISTHLHPAAVLFALEQIGAVEVNHDEGTIKLKAKGYIPRGNQAEGFQMLASDTENFVQAVMDNIQLSDEGAPLPNIHASTVYDNIDIEHVPKVKEWLARQCFALHQRAERFIAKFDLDVHPNSKKKGGGKIFLGSFTRAKWD
ncbi:MAG: DUF6502 family protein [bacterium]|nr:DUF6502 family protein [bacterium]